jgi:hypothetical protein
MNMMLWRSLGIGVWMVTASAVASAQYRFPYPVPDVPGTWPGAPSESRVIRTHLDGTTSPSQRVESRTRVNGVDIVTSIIERPDVEGRMRPSVETTTATVRTRPNAESTRHDVVAFDQSGRRMLIASTESEQKIRADGSIDIVRLTSAPDPAGHLVLVSREVEHTRSVSPEVTETERVLFLVSDHEMVETERVNQRERQVGAGLVRREMTRSVRDVNGQFHATETRSEEVRTSPSDSREEATIQRPDVTGKLAVDERTVVHRSNVDGRERTTVETSTTEGAARPGNLQLNRRLTRTTTSAADGSSRTDEDVEARVPFAPGEPLHPVQRSSGTIRNIDERYWEMQRRLSEVDVNHQMTPIVRETGTATASGSNGR